MLTKTAETNVTHLFTVNNIPQQESVSAGFYTYLQEEGFVIPLSLTLGERSCYFFFCSRHWVLDVAMPILTIQITHDLSTLYTFTMDFLALHIYLGLGSPLLIGDSVLPSESLSDWITNAVLVSGQCFIGRISDLTIPVRIHYSN